MLTNQITSTSTNAKILQVKILSQFKFYEIHFAIGNGLKSGFKINKYFPWKGKENYGFYI